MKTILLIAILGQLALAAVMNEPRDNPSSSHHTSSQHSSAHTTSSKHSSTHPTSTKHSSTHPTSTKHSTTLHPSSHSPSHTTSSSSTSTGPSSNSSIVYTTGPAPVVCTYTPLYISLPIVKNGGFGIDFLASWAKTPSEAINYGTHDYPDYDYGLLADTGNTNAL